MKDKISFYEFMKKSFEILYPSKKFYNAWYIKVISDILEGSLQKKISRIIINLPPRSMKSFCVSVTYPAWVLANDPTKSIIVASYSNALSIKHLLDTRYIMQSNWYKENFPETIISKEQNTKIKFQTTKRGFRMATSVGGTLTGEGADILITDDPINPLQAMSEKFRSKVINWFEQTFMTRLNTRKSIAIIVMHRLHSSDLVGYLSQKPHNIWHKISIPIIAEKDEEIFSVKNPKKLLFKRNAGNIINEKYYSISDIEEIKYELGTYTFASQYMQSPLNENLGIIKREWIKRYYEIPKEIKYSIVHSWDTASSTQLNGDFSVCSIYGKINANFYLLDVVRGRWEYSELKKKLLDLAKEWEPHAILIENKSSGISIIQELQHYTSLPIIKINPVFDKKTRLYTIIPLIESGKLLLPQSGNWLTDFEYELFSFPYSTHDDQIDTMVQYLNWIRSSIYNTANIRSL